MAGFKVSKIRENPVKAKLAAGQAVVGSWL